MNVRSSRHVPYTTEKFLDIHFLGLPLPIWALTIFLVTSFLTAMIYIVKKWTSDYYSVYWGEAQCENR